MKCMGMILGPLLAVLAGTTQVWAEEPTTNPPTRAKGPTIEIAFVLDTTGSMGGLIAGAKEKIWAIANQIASGKPRPDVFMALVPYRDKGDAYVTKLYALTTNLDQVYTDLMTFEAQGGGDTPENVNQALYDAIHKIQWSSGDKVTRIIYLVGDCPPHNEYQDVPTYDKLAKAAIDKGIYINTILCGNNSDARTVWQAIARRAEGEFIQIAQDGAVRTIDTPYDAELSELNRKLISTTVVYGETSIRATQKALNDVAGAKIAKPESSEGRSLMRKSADRAAFSVKAGKAASNDLLSDMVQGKIRLEDVDEKKLPENMQKMTIDERKAFVVKQQNIREELSRQIKDVSAKRAEYLKKEMTKAGAAPSFDTKVLDSLKRQAGRNGVEYSD
ncbi:MAG: VWA domain-containing protein [Pirellulales bacterium]|nr:VWA domain-containing protein [Pirellulales bacterium]